MPDLLNIALSGLIVHQRGLTTTGHNIANAATEGYSRQSSINATRPAEFLGGSYLGNGVDLEGVRRIVDEFAVRQLRSDISALKQAETLRLNLDQLDSLFADSDTGLTQNLQRFFAAVQGANDDPTSIPARQVVLSEGENLIKRFNQLSATLENQARDVDQQLSTVVSEITQIGAEIAEINQAIVAASGAGAGQQPNDLLDQRDRLLQELSELVSISTTEQSDGAVNVFLGSGQALVLSGESLALITRPSAADPRISELAIQSKSTTITLSSALGGGVLGGLLEMRDTVLGGAINSLGRTALALADSLNRQHRMGMDLEGNLGGDLFTDINNATAIAGRTLGSSANSLPHDQVVDVSINDLSALTTSDYRLTFTSATTYVVTRLSDGLTNTAIDPGLSGSIAGLPATLQFDGLSVALDRPSGNFAAGDVFLLKPTRQAATDIGLNISRPEQLALASPVRTEANINNQGFGVITAGEVTDISAALFSTTPGQLSPPLLIRFTGTGTYDILDNTNPAAPIPLAPPQTGLTFPPTPGSSLLPSGFGIHVEISGQPQAGDTFTVDFNSNGFQDNRNGLALTDLQTAKLLDNGTTSIQSSYGRLLQEVGSKASQARFNEQAATSLVEQSQKRRDEISGVNLDEEAARLVELEQAYGASAQVIGVARSIFDTLLNVIG